jgi:hypothetical protein
MQHIIYDAKLQTGYWILAAWFHILDNAKFCLIQTVSEYPLPLNWQTMDTFVNLKNMPQMGGLEVKCQKSETVCYAAKLIT